MKNKISILLTSMMLLATTSSVVISHDYIGDNTNGIVNTLEPNRAYTDYEHIVHDDEEDVDYYDDIPTRVNMWHLGKDIVLRSIYSDEIFFKDSSTYHHLLAKQSIGLALCAYELFDPVEEECEDCSAGSLLDYFHYNGFDYVRIDDFDKNTSIYTIGTGIACKTIEYKGEYADLVAVAIRGNKYVNEWQSNFTLGTNTIHEGFYQAATLVTDRILSYIGQTHFEHPVKVWITGFSRAAAIANIVSAFLNDSVVLSKEQVFSYTFATPRARWSLNGDEEDYLTGYENIFNILGASDIIAQFVPAEWSYYHYGIDLYLPGAEYDSKFQSKYKTIQEVLLNKFNVKTYYNVDLNMRARILIGLLLEMSDSDFTYKEVLQPFIVGLLSNKRLNNIAKLFRETQISWKNEHPEITAAKERLFDYLVNFIPPLLTGKSYMQNQQPTIPNKIMTLAHEHFSELYYHFLYNFTPAELYSNNNGFSYLLIEGNGTINVKDKASSEQILTLKNSNKTLSEYAVNNNIDLSVYKVNSKTILVLPYDLNYEVSYITSRSESLNVKVIDYGRTFSSKLKSYDYNINSNSSGVLVDVLTNKATFSVDPTEIRTSDLATTLNINKGLFHYRYYLINLVFVVTFMITLIVWLIKFLNLKLKNKDFDILRLILISVFVVSVTEAEILYWLCADAIILSVIFKILAALCVASLYLFRKDFKQLKCIHKTIIPFLFLMLIGNIVISFSVIAGLILYILGLAYLCYYLLSKTKLSNATWITWIISSLVAIILVACIIGFAKIDVSHIFYLIMLPGLLLTQFAVRDLEGTKETATHVLLVAFIMLGIFLILEYALISSILFVIFINIVLAFYALNFDKELNDSQKTRMLITAKAK